MSRFGESLRSRAHPLALEITPPRALGLPVLLRRAAALERLPLVINVIQREGRMTSLEASAELGQHGLEPVWHFANRGLLQRDVDHALQRAREAGLRDVLCLRGDHPAQDSSETPKLREVVARACAILDSSTVGVTANQHQDRVRVLRNLFPKLEAGAFFVQTQPVLDLSSFEDLASAIRDRAPAVAIVPMVMPLLSIEDADRFAKRIGLPVPGSLARVLARDGEAGGWRFLQRVLDALLRSGLADGLAVMTPTMDAPPELAQRLGDALRSAGWGRR